MSKGKEVLEILVQRVTGAAALYDFMEEFQTRVKDGWVLSDIIEHYPRQHAPNHFTVTLTKLKESSNGKKNRKRKKSDKEE